VPEYKTTTTSGCEPLDLLRAARQWWLVNHEVYEARTRREVSRCSAGWGGGVDWSIQLPGTSRSCATLDLFPIWYRAAYPLLRRMR